MFIASMMVRTTGFGHESFCLVEFHVKVWGLYFIETERYAFFFFAPPPSRVVRLAPGGEVDGRRLLKERILGGLQ